MKENYSIEEILNAVSDLNKDEKKNLLNNQQDKNIGIPKDTLKLIEEAEKNTN